MSIAPALFWRRRSTAITLELNQRTQAMRKPLQLNSLGERTGCVATPLNVSAHRDLIHVGEAQTAEVPMEYFLTELLAWSVGGPLCDTQSISDRYHPLGERLRRTQAYNSLSSRSCVHGFLHR